MKNNNHLFIMRKKRKMTQDQVASGIVERQTYSNYERGISTPDIGTYFQLIDRMGYNPSDVVKEDQNEDQLRQYYRLFTHLRIQGGKKEDYINLYDFAVQNRYYNNRSLSLYLLTKTFFHRSFPNEIPDVNESDKLILKTYIGNLTTNFSFYDLRLIADFSYHVLDLDDMKNIYEKMTPFDPLDYVESQHSYTTQIHKIFSNFTDFALSKGDLDFAEKVLNDHLCFSKIHPNIKYNLLRQTSIAIMDFLKTNDKKTLAPYKTVADCFRTAGDGQTAEIIMDQYNQLMETDSFNSGDHLAIE